MTELQTKNDTGDPLYGFSMGKFFIKDLSVYRVATFYVSTALHQLYLLVKMETEVQGSFLQKKENWNLVKNLTEEKAL